MLQNKKIKAFTLVELIVTITILAILGTIAFISFQGYSRDARDSIRSADIALIQKALETYKIPVGKYPIPTDTEPVLFSGSTAWTQGTVGDSVIQNLSNLNKIPLDPLYGTEYTYSVTSDYKEFEVGALFEGDLLGSNLFINQANANPNYTAYIKGTYNGKTLRVRAGGKDYILAIPSVISTDIAGWTLQDLINNFKLVFHGYGNLPASYEGVIADLEGGFNYAPGAIVVFSGAIEDLKDTGAKVEFIQNLQTAYSGTILEYTDTYYEVANVQIDPNNPTDEVIALASMNINLNTGLDLPVPTYTSSLPPLNEVSGVVVENGEGSCDETTKPADNGYITYVIGNPTVENQAYIKDSNNCGYSCLDGYTGTSCENPLVLGWTELDTNCDTPDVVIGSQTWAGCNSTLGIGTERLQEGTCLDYNGNDTGTCTPGSVYMLSNSKADFWYSGVNNNGDSEYNNIWGKFYTGDEAGGACSNGWHLPSNEEFALLENTLNGSECRTGGGVQCDGLGWMNHNTKTDTNNLANALKLPLTGYRSIDGLNSSRGNSAYLWSSSIDELDSTKNYYRYTSYNSIGIGINSISRTYGFPVRCIKDTP